MSVLPYRQFELLSPLSAGDATTTLANAVEAKRWFRWGWGASECPFEGTVTDSTFEIQRIISYRNSFLPLIRGTIAAEPPGSRISITMRLNAFVLVFMVVWLGGVAAGGVAIAIGVLTGRVEIVFLFIPVGMFLFGGLLTAGAFAFEARKAEQAITNLLHAHRRAAESMQEKPPGFF